MKTLKILLIAITAFTGCAKKTDLMQVINTPTPPTTTPVTVSDSVTYLALGDSYTIGQSVAQAQSFPYQLAGLLTQQGYKCENPAIIATTGWTTDNLIDAIATSGITAKKFSFVTLLVGVNDQYQGLSQSNYQAKFTQVLNTAISFANGDKSKVFVLSIPDYGVTPFAGGRESTIGPEIDQFNAINKSISLNAGVNYLDITGISKEAAVDPTLIAGDGLHPSGKMYGLWVHQLLPLVVAQIKK